MRVVAVFVAALVLAGAAAGKPPDPMEAFGAAIAAAIRENPCFVPNVYLPAAFAKRYGIKIDKQGKVVCPTKHRRR